MLSAIMLDEGMTLELLILKSSKPPHVPTTANLYKMNVMS